MEVEDGHKQAAELQAQLAKVKAKLKKSGQEPVTQAPRQASPEAPRAKSAERYAEPAEAMPKEGSSEASGTKLTESFSEPVAAKSKSKSSELVQETRKAETSSSEAQQAERRIDPQQNGRKITYTELTESPLTGQMTSEELHRYWQSLQPVKAKTSSSEAQQVTHKTGGHDGEKDRLEGLAAALRGSEKTKSSAQVKRLFTAMPALFTTSGQGNTVLLGSAAITVAAALALAVRFVRASQPSSAVIDQTYELGDSAIE